MVAAKGWEGEGAEGGSERKKGWGRGLALPPPPPLAPPPAAVEAEEAKAEEGSTGNPACSPGNSIEYPPPARREAGMERGTAGVWAWAWAWVWAWWREEEEEEEAEAALDTPEVTEEAELMWWWWWLAAAEAFGRPWRDTPPRRDTGVEEAEADARSFSLYTPSSFNNSSLPYSLLSLLTSAEMPGERRASSGACC